MPLVRKTPMKRGTSQLARSPMKRKADKEKVRRPEKLPPALRTPCKPVRQVPTAAEKEYYDRVAQLGCMLSRRLGHYVAPELHHPRFLGGAGMKSPNWCVIPLSPYHHRLGPAGNCLHAGRRSFEARHGTEAELLAQTLRDTGLADDAPADALELQQWVAARELVKIDGKLTLKPKGQA